MNTRGVQLDPLAAYYAALTHEELVARCVSLATSLKTTRSALVAADHYIRALERQRDIGKTGL